MSAWIASSLESILWGGGLTAGSSGAVLIPSGCCPGTVGCSAG